MINKFQNILTKDSISEFLSDNYSIISNCNNKLSQDKYLHLQYICSYLKKDTYLLSKLSLEELNLLTNNSQYQIKGLTIHIAKEFLYKKSYHIFRDSLLNKGQNWMAWSLKLEILQICLQYHSYNDDEIKLISKNIFYTSYPKIKETKKFLNVHYNFHKKQALQLILCFFQDLPQFISKNSFVYEHEKMCFFKNFQSMVFNLSDTLSDELIRSIPSLPKESVSYFLEYCQMLNNEPEQTLEHNLEMSISDYNNLYYSQFENVDIAKKIIKAFYKSLEQNILDQLKENDELEVISYSLDRIFSSTMKVCVFYNISNDTMKKIIPINVLYNYCKDITLLISGVYPLVPNNAQLEILNNELRNNNDSENILKLIKSKFVNINFELIDTIFHFHDPKIFSLCNENLIKQICYLEKIHENKGIIIKYVKNKLGYSIFKNHTLELSSAQQKIITIAFEMELSETIPVNSLKTNLSRVRKF